MAGLTALALAGGFVFYQQLNGNLRTSALFAGLTGDAGTEKADSFGRVPINVLVIGSDTRSGRADCRLGGACSKGGAGANADVEMVVHVAADRSNATVMSVPRDTVSQLPACRSPRGALMPQHVGQINTTLQYGPGCTVAAVHHLTGIPIDHFVMVDFAGVIAMSDAVGGAQVCVTSNVYDPYSHLKLSKGTHTLKGLAALEFVRSRHAFGDGSDIGRTYAQHVFLSAVIRNLKSAGTLANPATLYGLANSATKALTVDKGLSSIPSLLGLAAALNKVPAKKITFVTMQNRPDPVDRNRVIPGPSAAVLFGLIAQDQPLTASAAPRPSSTDAPPAGGQAGGQPGGQAGGQAGGGTAAQPAAGAPNAQQKALIAVRVENGGGVAGRASAVAKDLVGQGFSPRTTSTTAPAPAATTQLEYGAGRRAAAEAVAQVLGVPEAAIQPGPGTGVTLIIGADWPAGTTFRAAAGGTSTAGTPTSDTTTALKQAHARTVDQRGTCVAASTQKTVVVGGIPMTPAQAYRASSSVPVSAH